MKKFEKNTVPECLADRITMLHGQPWAKVATVDGEVAISLRLSWLHYDTEQGGVYLLATSSNEEKEVKIYVPETVVAEGIRDPYGYQLQEKGGTLWCTIATLYGDNAVEVCLNRLYRNDAGEIMLRLLVGGVLADVKVA